MEFNMNKNDFINMSKVQKKPVAILLLNDLLEEDFDPIINALEFKKDLLIITTTDFKKKNYGVNFIVDDLENIDSLIKKVSDFKIKNNVEFCGIIGLDEEYKYSFSKAIADKFNLPSNSKETLDLVANKYIQISKLKKGGVDVPDFKLFEKYDEIKDFTLPCVIKPVRGISSLYVYKNNTPQELKSNFKLIEAYKTDSNFLSLANTDKSAEKPFIIEEFIDGNEYSCDFFVGKEILLLRVAKKIVSKEYFPFFEGYYLFNPDNDSNSEFSASDLKIICQKIAKSLDIKNGLCMVDFRFDKKKKKILLIETTTRPGVDDFICLMDKYYHYISLNVALRNMFGTLDYSSFRKLPAISSAIVYILAPKPGILSKIDTKKLSNLNLPYIEEIKTYFNVGEKVESLGLTLTPPYVGHVVLKGIKYNELDKVIATIRSNTIIQVK
jgi:predicted ATP-grasp superfamily ATP-dependent carboligase